MVDLPPSAFEALRSSGALIIPKYLYRFYRGRLPDLRVGDTIIANQMPTQRPVLAPHQFGGTAIRIDVEDR